MMEHVDCFWETDFPMPDGWKWYGAQSRDRQEYCYKIYTVGNHGFWVHAVVTTRGVKFRTRYRESFKRENVEALLDVVARFEESFWKMRKGFED